MGRGEWDKTEREIMKTTLGPLGAIVLYRGGASLFLSILLHRFWYVTTFAEQGTALAGDFGSRG